MSWFLFMDESGHDHRNMPYEIRGGVALSVTKLWYFIQGWRRLELDCFGVVLSDYGKEAKGEKLLDKDRFKWAQQGAKMSPEERRKLSRAFLERGRDKIAPNRDHFTAYGQASLEMARGVFDLLSAHDAKLFASFIPRGTKPPPGFIREDYLRKDQVFLLERYFYFLDGVHKHGLLVMDETEKSADRRFVKKLEAYFEKTETGRNRALSIVPSPLFVASDMSYAVQAADICLYCLNWGYRVPGWEAESTVRDEIAEEFGPKLRNLQWIGEMPAGREDRAFRSYGIVLVRDPYQSRAS